MQYFIGPPAEATEVRQTEDYIEIVSPVDGVSIISYVIRVDSMSTWAVCNCFDQAFDQIFKTLDNPQYGSIYLAEFRKLYPTFFRVYDNAVNQRYGDGALAEFVDPDDMNRKWFVASMFQAAGREQAEEKYPDVLDRVIGLSAKVTSEFGNKLTRLQKAKVLVKGAAAGYRVGKAKAEPREKRLDWLRTLANQ